MRGVWEMVEYLNSLDTSSLIALTVSAVAGLSLFVEIVPVKINPWTKILKWIGNCMFGDTNQKLIDIEKRFDSLGDDIDKRFQDLKADVNRQVHDVGDSIDENELDRIRWEILDFASKCRRGSDHTKDEFEHVIAQNTKYERLLEKTGRENGVYTEEYKYIMRIYHDRQEKNDFL